LLARPKSGTSFLVRQSVFGAREEAVRKFLALSLQPHFHNECPFKWRS
jgi:hypothetical protein